MGRVTPLLTSHKVLDITYQTPQETLLDPPETLPISEPADPQVAYTVQESDLPTFSNNLYSKIYLARLLAGGQFITAGTCYWRMTKNGASVSASSFGVTANYYYVIEACFFNVNVGDVLGIKLWSNQADSNWDRKALSMHVSRIYPLKTSKYAFVNIIASGSQTFTNFTATTSGTVGTAYIYNGHTSIEYSSSLTAGFSLTNIIFLACVSPYGMFRTGMGDSAISNAIRSSTGATRPNVFRFPVPTSLTFRGALID